MPVIRIDFDKDQIDWKPNPALHNFYQSLFLLRQQHKAFNADAEIFFIHTNEEENIFAYLLANNTHKVLVLLNLSPNNRIKFTAEHSRLSGKYKSLFSGFFYEFKNREHFELQSGEYGVYITEA